MAKGIISWGEIAEKLPLLIVECRNCGRRGQYRTAPLVKKYGADSSIAQFQADITKNCPKRSDPTVALGHGCAPLCPQLSEVF